MTTTNPLNKAIKNNHLDAVELLLINGAKINGQENAKTPLTVAICNDHICIVKLLLEYGATVDLSSLLTTYIDKGGSDIMMVDILLKNGNGGTIETPFISAIKKDRYDMVELMMKHTTCKINDRYVNDPPIFHATSMNMARLLSAHPHFDINATNKQRDTLLMKAVSKGKLELVRWILSDVHVDPNMFNANDKTALHKALMLNQSPLKYLIVEELLRHPKIKLNMTSRPNFSPIMPIIHVVLGLNDEHMMEMFRQYGANMNISDRNGNTMLHTVVLYGGKDKDISASILLARKYGVDMDVKNKDGSTALDVAKRMRKHSVVDTLVSCEKNRYRLL